MYTAMSLVLEEIVMFTSIPVFSLKSWRYILFSKRILVIYYTHLPYKLHLHVHVGINALYWH